VSGGTTPVSDQKAGRCPFLSETLKTNTLCDKAPNSRGVCTISATSNGPRQDWLVCPNRALDDDLLADMTRRLYAIPAATPILIRPVLALADETQRSEILRAVRDREHVFVYFQSILGGEIHLSKSPASPELSFDVTIVELLRDEGTLPIDLPGSAVRLGRYGVIEMQTTDTHGSYKQTVDAMTHALDLFGDRFPEVMAENPDWAGRKVEGPNISNVFKRTFYQIIFKFQVTKRETSVGCALALPQPVWDSWQPFLGAPDLHQHEDGTWRLLDDQASQPSDWIYIFDIDPQPRSDGRPAPIRIQRVIGTDAATLSRAAFEVAPAKALEHGGDMDAVAVTIARRLGDYLPGMISSRRETPHQHAPSHRHRHPPGRGAPDAEQDASTHRTS